MIGFANPEYADVGVGDGWHISRRYADTDTDYADLDGIGLDTDLGPVRFFCTVSTDGNPPLAAAFNLIDKGYLLTCIHARNTFSRNRAIYDWEAAENYWPLNCDGEPYTSRGIGIDLLMNDLFGVKIAGSDWRDKLEALSRAYPLGAPVTILENQHVAIALYRTGDAVVEDQEGGFGLWKDDQINVLGADAVLPIPLDAVSRLPSRDQIERHPVPPAELFDKLAARLSTKAHEIASGNLRQQVEVIASADDAADEMTSDELPAHLTRPAGLLSEMVDWITASARRPNPVLALGAAITTFGTIIGRRVAGPTQSGTHLYVAMLAPSAAGKDHPQRCAADMLRAACPTAQLVGPGEFASQTALSNYMAANPLNLSALDEFGAFLARICAQKASAWERGITKLLREYWGCSFKTVESLARAGGSSAPIQWPAISVLGASVHCEFYDALGSKDTTNGFLNRFLL